MKGDAKVIQFLNKALGNELVAINQYFLHSRILGDWGLSKLAENCLLYTSPSPRDKRQSRMPSSA